MTLTTLFTLAALAAALWAAGHALVTKRDPRSALAWIGFTLLVPALGAALYFLFGINRVKTRARKLRIKRGGIASAEARRESSDLEGDTGFVEELPVEYRGIARIAAAVSGLPLLSGNSVEMLRDGEEAFPAMLDAIERAETSVFLATYIFHTDESGRRFVDALERATARGLDVRVIVDGIGQLQHLSSWPVASSLLRRRGVRAETFLGLGPWRPGLHVNLRNHRKILVTDGRTAFTGGMNLTDAHLAARTDNPDRVHDVHFRLHGPVVGQLRSIFLADWTYCTGRDEPPPEEDAREPAGGALCRVIPDGPDEDLDNLLLTLVGAVSAARRSIRVMTPYFLPPVELATALEAAALRGVDVRIVLPERSDHRIVKWATRNMLGELLERGADAWYQPAPFVHSKLFVVDEAYAQIGTSNLDPRSLRLNFELNVEVFDDETARAIAAHVDEAISRSRRVTWQEIARRPVHERVRDAAAWLFSPYL